MPPFVLRCVEQAQLLHCVSALTYVGYDQLIGGMSGARDGGHDKPVSQWSSDF